MRQIYARAETVLVWLGRQSLKWLLQESVALLRAETPHDYIYALLGLANDGNKLGYTRPWLARTSTRATRGSILSHQQP